MKKNALVLILFFFTVQLKADIAFPTVRQNVCKTLQGKVILYAVFVDTKHTQPWSAYDLNSALDSIEIAMHWIKEKAEQNGVPLEIEIHYPSVAKRIPVKVEFPNKTLSKTLFSSRNLKSGINMVDTWSDKCSKKCAQNLPRDTSSIVLTKNKMNDRERLIARLRDIHETDNVALIFFTNHYYQDEISVALHTGNDSKIEYAICSTKSPAIIAHEFLHLFGAVDLYHSPFDRGRKVKRQKRNIMKKYPDEIMAFAHRDIDNLNISPLTKYLIGWDNYLSKEDARLIAKRKTKFLTY